MSKDIIVPEPAVLATIDAFTTLDASGDKRSMNKMARKLGKEQPALLQFAAQHRDEHGEQVGEAAVFYGTLVWAMFARNYEGTLPRLTPENIAASDEVVKAAIADVEDIASRPIHERTATILVAKQPHIYAKLQELLAEDVKEAAITAETAEHVFPTAQIIIEAFDAALDGRRPAEPQGTIIRDAPKLGRNDPCACGSGKKFKRCCAA